MSLVTFNFESQYLGCNHAVSIILPDRPRTMDAKDFYTSGKKYKVLWLLHGTHGDHTDWLRKSMVDLYARERGMIVVMPSALNSDYTNWEHFGTGFRMGDYLTEELMPIIYNWFPASDKQEDNFIAGLSMGGRGVLKYLLWHPEKFAAGAAFSACPRDFSRMNWDDPSDGLNMPGGNTRLLNQIKNAGGPEGFLKGGENSWDKVLEMHEKGTLPKLMVACGDADRLYGNYLKFKQLCEEREIPVTFFELPDLAHEWRFWDPALVKALDFFGI